MPVGSYQSALTQAKKWGVGSRVVPTGGAGGTGITYRAIAPSGGSGLHMPRTPSAATTAAPAGLSAAARSAFGEAEEYYQPGGGFGAGVEAQLGRARAKYMSSGMQSLVGAGLAGTTMAAGLGGKFAEEIAAPTRAGVESERARNIANLKLALAQTEQGAIEAGAGRQLGYAQLGAQTGLGYAQLGASRAGQAGQLGLGYAQLASQEKLAMARLAPQQNLPSLYGAIQGQQAPNLYA